MQAATEQMGSYEQVLEFAAGLVNAVRTFLTNTVNIDLPMWLAQAIVLALFLPLCYVFMRRASKQQAFAKRVAAWAGAVVTGAVSLTIVMTWMTYWRQPLFEQLEGEVSDLGANVEPATLHVDLLDFRGQTLGPKVQWISGSTHFLLNYNPEFADPPRLIRVGGTGCKSERRLRRQDLVGGTVISIALVCAGSP
jgi:hypothetical protein